MQNITQYGDSELSLLVYNTESLYFARQDKEYLKELIDMAYIYTPDQMAELMQDLDDEDDN